VPERLKESNISAKNITNVPPGGETGELLKADVKQF